MYSEVVQSAVYKIEYERKNENRGREKRVKGKKMVNDGILKNALLFFCDTQFSATFVFFFFLLKLGSDQPTAERESGLFFRVVMTCITL